MRTPGRVHRTKKEADWTFERKEAKKLSYNSRLKTLPQKCPLVPSRELPPK
jgi:hypothetical protein